MHTGKQGRCNGMVHTLPPAALPAAPIARHSKEINGVNTDMALRLAAFTKAALKSKLPSQQPCVKNGLTNTQPPTRTPVESRQQKTEASPTPGLASLHTTTPHSLISRHCSTVVHSRNTNALVTHTAIDCKLSTLLTKVRRKQLVITQAHAQRQLDSYTRNQPLARRAEEANLDASLPAQTDTPSSSLESSFSPSVADLAAAAESPDVCDAVHSLQQHLQCLGSSVDDELTCSSSDDDDEELEERRRGREGRNEVKRRWESDRAALGSRWAWLCHRITSVNQQIRQLNSQLQTHPPKDPITFSSPTLLTTVPCVCQQKQDNHASNGTTVPSLSLKGSNSSTKKLSISSSNGLSSPCPCQLRQMLLANSSGMTPHLQVRELLGCSFPVLLMEESTQTCARTRLLQLAPQRKIIRIKKSRRRGERSNKCYHQQLSQIEDIPSSLWLDSALHQILKEHSYASLPQTKRRKMTSSSLTMFNTPTSRSLIRMERSRSFSPSPSSFESCADKSMRAVPRKRNSTHLPLSGDSDSRPATPTLPFSTRKKRGTGTPSFDIDNIVIPYSIACSARLEKLEYKEIVTPKWREIGSIPLVVNGGHGNVKSSTLSSGENEKTHHRPHASRKLDLDLKEPVQEKPQEDVEDTSDEAFQIRHGKCEAVERKRYLNFITGATRKRSRPSTQASTPDSVHSPASLTGGDLEVTFLPQVLPWPYRRFPLVGKSLSELTNPLPPPQKAICSSPVFISDHSAAVTTTTSSSSSSSPLNTTSFTSPNQHNTPVHSPEPATSECPLAATSSSHWVVTNTTSTPANKQPSIVLKLAKRS